MNREITANADRRHGSRKIGGLSLFASLALLCVALLIRLPAHDGRPMWADELWRALLILDPHYLHNYFWGNRAEIAITSPLYILFVKAVSAFYVSTDTLRLSSFLPGVLAPVLAFVVIRMAGGSAALSFTGGLCFALNQIFASYSNELKPYMFEVFVHLACLYVWLAVLVSPRPGRRLWLLCFLTLTLAVLSAANIIFILPAFGCPCSSGFWSRGTDRAWQYWWRDFWVSLFWSSRNISFSGGVPPETAWFHIGRRGFAVPAKTPLFFSASSLSRCGRRPSPHFVRFRCRPVWRWLPWSCA